MDLWPWVLETPGFCLSAAVASAAQGRLPLMLWFPKPQLPQKQPRSHATLGF